MVGSGYMGVNACIPDAVSVTVCDSVVSLICVCTWILCNLGRTAQTALAVMESPEFVQEEHIQVADPHARSVGG